MSGEVMSVADVMRELDVSRPTVYNLIRRGKLTKHTSAIRGPDGSLTYFLREEVERLKGLNAWRGLRHGK